MRAGFGGWLKVELDLAVLMFFFLLQHPELQEIWMEYKGDLKHDTLLNLQRQKCYKDARTRYG